MNFRQIVPIFLAFTAALVNGCGKADPKPLVTGNRPVVVTQAPPTQGIPLTKPLAGPSDAAIITSDMARDYATNATAFDKKFKDKEVVVEGLVADSDVLNIDGEHSLLLAGVQKPGDPVGALINCKFSIADQEKVSRLTSSSRVKVRGKCLAHSATSLYVQMVGCTLLNSELAPGEPPLDGKAAEVTDLQLAQDMAAGKAFEKYRGQVLEVEGTVYRVGPKYFVLRGTYDPGKSQGTQVSCRMAPAAGDKANALTVGQLVKIKGRWMGTYLSNCEVSNVGPDPVLRVSAAQLSEDYTKDAAAADKRYKDKQVQVEGVVVEVKPIGGFAGAPQPAVILEGAPNKDARPLRVEALLPTNDKLQPAWKLTKGQKVQFKGQCVGKMGENITLWYVNLLK